ncbi:hypothetical protein ACJ2A9_02945 [Anaerobacillus sp. MEB173]|uniref:hypothetical protein n=1 Tax=Anaerobacillus sp. MEB173 TaxID=3383345 RepID=UPI003F93C1C6
MIKIPRPLDRWELMFKVREANVTAENQVACALKGSVCVDKCHDCVWKHSVIEENNQVTVVCQPPVIWEE